MAGDWIKMRVGLADDPAVISIARATKLEPDHVCGKLLTLWGWADQNTSNGRLDGVDATWIDAKVGKRGFCAALCSISPPWLILDDSGVTIPNFERHNGSSAKARAENTKRQTLSRVLRDNCATEARQNCDKSATREEKRRVLSTTSDDGWDAARQKANEIVAKLGGAYSARDRRLLLGCCRLAENFRPDWLDAAVKTTQAAKPKTPYAYLQTVLARDADAAGVDLLVSINALEIPDDLVERRRQPC